MIVSVSLVPGTRASAALPVAPELSSTPTIR
jgi:hypothetical protein